MRQVIFVTILMVVSFGVGFGIWFGIFRNAPDRSLMHTMYQGGPLVIALLAMLVMLMGFIIERSITLYHGAAGKASVQSFFKKVITAIQKGDYEGAIAACDKQKGTVANILRAGMFNKNRADEYLATVKKYNRFTYLPIVLFVLLIIVLVFGAPHPFGSLGIKALGDHLSFAAIFSMTSYGFWLYIVGLLLGFAQSRGI